MDVSCVLDYPSVAAGLAEGEREIASVVTTADPVEEARRLLES